MTNENTGYKSYREITITIMWYKWKSMPGKLRLETKPPKYQQCLDS